MTTPPTPSSIPYCDDSEVIPADEADDIRDVVESLKIILQRHQQKTGLYQADVHVKGDGCAQGEFRVSPHLPSELAQGLFHREQTFSAVVRFSNSASQVQPDWLPDGRGMAIKVLGVDGDPVIAEERGRTQDFIMINHPVFFARNVKDYLRLEQVLVAANDNPIATVSGALTGGDWNPMNWHWREAVTALRIIGHLPAHPAANTYYSMAPIRFGQYVAKYRVKPARDGSDSFVNVVKKLGQEADALRLMLEATLRSQVLLFEFQVQLRNSADTMPIEDATIEWPEAESPFRTVALISLPRQDIAASAWRTACERLSFNVWHALAAHRPLGGINRVRREVYQLSSAWRHTPSRVQSKEPQSIEELLS